MLLVLLLLLTSAKPAWLRETQPDFSLYHTQDELLKRFEEVVARHPATMKMELLGKDEDDGYSVRLPVVTLEPGGLSDGQNKIRLLMSFGEHAREIVTTELALKLLECFDSEENLQHCIPDAAQYKAMLRILPHVLFKMVPVENPRGREKVENGEMCERKNGRGVDINRNWDVDFGKREPDYDPSEEYGGEAAFSEPETVMMRQLADSLKPHVWVAVHSGTCAVFMPYDHIGVLPEGPSADAQLQILKTLKQETLRDDCLYGPGGKTVGYVAHGTGTDYMYSVLKVPLAFTWEIYGDSSAAYEDCYSTFNPTTSQSLQELLSMWISTVFRFIELLPDHPDIPDVIPKRQKALVILVPEEVDAEPADKDSEEFVAVKAVGVIREEVVEYQASQQFASPSPRFRANFTPLLLGVTPLILGMIVVLRLFARRPKTNRLPRSLV